jgi:hypothetical protein
MRVNNPDGSITLGVKLGASAQESTAAVMYLASYFGWLATVNGQPNPETRAQFVDRALREQVHAWAKEGRASAAAKVARDSEDAKPLPEVQ